MKSIKKDITIITEGEFDAKFLSKLFANKKYSSNLHILSASGFSSALSKVKTILSSKETSVLLILDTDTISENDILDKKSFVNTYLKQDFFKNRIKIIWAIPEFEIIFLNNKKFLQELTNSQVNDELIEIGKVSPKRTLEKISNRKREDFISYLDKKEINDEFYKDDLILDIENFIKK